MSLNLELTRSERARTKELFGSAGYGMPWDDAANDQLRELVILGRTRKEMAKITGRTSEAISRQCTVLGIRPLRDSYGGSYKPKYHRVTYEQRADQEARDRAFIRALALAIYRGEHLPGASYAPAA